MKLLFVCSRNRIRSLTAEHDLAGRPGLAVRSAGTAASARVSVTAGHVGWADVVVVMEKRHQEQLAALVEPLLEPVASATGAVRP